jgi:hypothetical protein
MEQNKKGALLLAAAVAANVYGIAVIISFSDSITRLWPVVFVIAASSVLSFFGWKNKSKMLLITGAVFYLFSLNFISLILCVIAILWDGNDELSMQGKQKNSLFVIAGVLAVLGLLIWFIPMTGKEEGSSVYVPLYPAADESTGVVPTVDKSLRPFSMFTTVLDTVSDRAMGLNWAIGFLTAYVAALALSFVGKLRNNPKKALLAAVFYIFSLSVLPAIMCFIGYVSLRKQSAREKELDPN